MKILNSLRDKFFKKPEPKFLYEVIGHESGVYELVNNFYNIMETDSYARDCLITHEIIDNKVPDIIKKKFFMFLCGWFGGPNLFVEKYGHPRMKARHSHVKIGEKERVQWLYCMEKALDMHTPTLVIDDRVRFDGSFKALASRVQNIY